MTKARSISIVILLAYALFMMPHAWAQLDAAKLFPNGAFGGPAANALESGLNGDPYEITADYVGGNAPNEAIVRVRVRLAAGWHLYSLTQPAGGPPATKLTLQSKEVQSTSAWQASEPPAKSVSAEFGGITIEEHSNSVTFSTTVKSTGSTGAKDWGDLQLEFNGLTCIPNGACLPIEEVLTAKFAGQALVASNSNSGKPQNASEVASNSQPTKPVAGTGSQIQSLMSPGVDDLFDAIASSPLTKSAKAETNAGGFRDSDYVVQWQATLSPSVVAPGGVAHLTFTAIPDTTFHVYSAAVNDADAKTNFVVTEPSGLSFGAPQTDAQVLDYDATIAPGVTYHPGTVTWTIPITVPIDASEGTKSIAGGIAYQACQESSCREPLALTFATELEIRKVTDAASDGFSVVELWSAKRSQVLDDAASIAWVQTSNAKVELPQTALSFPMLLLIAFGGGVILNFMPCVLPVVGLKVMSFVQQAGENRLRVFLLNIVYALGILSVFGGLTFLAVVMSLSWGEQFTFFPVRMGLTVLLFAMALSYLGVWEIPAPGMASNQGSQKLQRREGYTGAFFKGAFATVLATPCSGPMLGSILGLTIAFTPWQTTAVIMSVGVGMSLPYLLIGLWPGLISWLPKPGHWMETLKEFMAFLFLGTVAFFFHQFNDADKLAVFVTLIGVWFGCWVIGKVPAWANLRPRIASWLFGTAAATAIGVGAFTYLGPPPPPSSDVKQIAWQPYDEAELKRLQSEGRTVMIDFTAKWCVNCIVNYKVAINTEETRKLIEELDAVPMLADWTERDPVIKSKLTELQSRSIPLLAIYPGQTPEQPIVLRDLVSQNAVSSALREAGPSRKSNGPVKADANVATLKH